MHPPSLFHLTWQHRLILKLYSVCCSCCLIIMLRCCFSLCLRKDVRWSQAALTTYLNWNNMRCSHLLHCLSLSGHILNDLFRWRTCWFNEGLNFNSLALLAWLFYWVEECYPVGLLLVILGAVLPVLVCIPSRDHAYILHVCSLFWIWMTVHCCQHYHTEILHLPLLHRFVITIM